jgi:hypothetical protein
MRPAARSIPLYPDCTRRRHATVPRDTEREQSPTGDAGHHPDEAFHGPGKSPSDVGVTTRHANRDDDGDVDAPRVVPGRPTFPIGTERSDDGAPTEVIDFEPRDATPPSTEP